MKRRNFLSTVGFFLAALPALLNAKLEIIRSEKRHVVKKGWMDLRESFNYLDYDSADEMGFGILRKIDDFTMDHLTGTPIHPHKNMEILTILLEGELFHEDSLGNSGLIKAGEMQLISAGSGLKHAETNPSRFTKAKGFQIWLSCSIRDTAPAYQIKLFDEKYFTNTLSIIFSPDQNPQCMRIQQNAYLYRGQSTKPMSYTSPISHRENGFYLHVISGEVRCDNQSLKQGDGIGVSEVSKLTICAEAHSDFLLFDIPMEGKF